LALALAIPLRSIRMAALPFRQLAIQLGSGRILPLLWRARNNDYVAGRSDLDAADRDTGLHRDLDRLGEVGLQKSMTALAHLEA
jgi:hypothetical protein